MKLPWSGSKKPTSSASGGMVTSIGVGVGSTAMVPVSQSSGSSRRPAQPNLTVTRMDERPGGPASGRFKLNR